MFRITACFAAAALVAACASDSEPPTEAPVATEPTPLSRPVIDAPRASYPGVSFASDSLSAEVLGQIQQRSAADVTRSTGISCDPSSVELLDRRIASRRRTANSPWTETWLVDACRDEIAWTVDFAPSSTGDTRFRLTRVRAK